ncbi:hypothetical protein OJAV_G00074300 [Oryzias javanicus]|uniref:Uncharacterized protein n=1 Tax=Oryzias javanicus TaxID=123683 RepID=A0A437D356_ORYJA|nr:hypothetical protein OJAV_G00074300 [Oryzias javanicus]
MKNIERLWAAKVLSAHQRGESEYGGREDDPVVQWSCGDFGRASALLTMTRKPSGGARPPASGHPPPPDADHRPRVDILPPGGDGVLSPLRLMN